MKLMLRLAVILWFASSSPASADVTANYVGLGNVFTMKIEIASNGDVRGSTSNPNSYFITREGHGYLVQASFDGPVVMRIEDMALVMADQMKKLMPKLPADVGKDFPVFELTRGPSVTVRGRQGTAYYMGNQTKHSTSERPAVVISTDPALGPIGTAMERQFEMSNAMMGQLLGKNTPFAGMIAVLKTGAPLTFAGAELDTVQYAPIPDARFVLPAAPLTLDGVRKNMGAANP